MTSLFKSNVQTVERFGNRFQPVLKHWKHRVVALFSTAFFVLPIGLLLNGCNTRKSHVVAIAKANQWEKLGPGGGGATFIPTFSYTDPDSFVLRCDMTGSYVTHDGGMSYHQVNYPNGASAYAYDPQNSSSIWLGGATLNHSKDGGITWRRVFPDSADVVSEQFHDDHATYRISVVPGSLYPQGKHVGAIVVDGKRRGAVYFSMGEYFFYSYDDGNSWKRAKLGGDILKLFTDGLAYSDQVMLYTADSVYSFQKSTAAYQNSVAHENSADHQNPVAHKSSDAQQDSAVQKDSASDEQSATQEGAGVITSHALPDGMRPAFSFTGGSRKEGGYRFYALHHKSDDDPDDEFGNSELWTSDDGLTWRSVSGQVINNIGGQAPSYSMIACAERDASAVYLVTNRYEELKDGKKLYWYGALKSDDGSDHWSWVWKGGGGSGQYGVRDGTDAANLDDAWARDAFGGEYIRLMDVGVYPDDGNVAIVTDWYRTMKTMDGGKTWREVYSEKQPNGTYKSRGLDVTTAYAVHFDPFDSNHIAISYTDIGYHHSYDGGKTWTRSVNGVPPTWVNTCYAVVFDPKVKGRIWSVWSGLHDFPRGKMTRDPQWRSRAVGGVCQSDDGGKTWRPLTDKVLPAMASTSIVLDERSPVDQRTLYVSAFGHGVYKSVDGGKSWEAKNVGIGDNNCAFELTLSPNGSLFLTVSATPAHKNNQRGREFYSGEVYRSTDGAEHWTRLIVSKGQLSNGSVSNESVSNESLSDGPPSNRSLFPNGIGIDPVDPNRIYLGCWSSIELSDLVGGNIVRATGGPETINMPGGIFVSDDNGDTWKSIFDEHQYVYDVTTDPRHPERVYCNTFDGGAWRSDDRGATWKRIKCYDFHWGQRVVVDVHDKEKVYLTTYGSSVWHGVPEMK